MKSFENVNVLFQQAVVQLLKLKVVHTCTTLTNCNVLWIYIHNSYTKTQYTIVSAFMLGKIHSRSVFSLYNIYLQIFIFLSEYSFFYFNREQFLVFVNLWYKNRTETSRLRKEDCFKKKTQLKNKKNLNYAGKLGLLFYILYLNKF